MRNSAIYLVGAIAGVSMLALSLSPASAFTLSEPSLQLSAASAQTDKVWWRRYGYGWRGYGWRGYGWRGYGWRPGYWGPGHCWRGYYGHVHCN
jgi:hypothetical protein